MTADYNGVVTSYASPSTASYSFQALRHIYHHSQLGDLLMDSPSTDTWEQLVTIVKDKDGWRRKVNVLKAAARKDPVISPPSNNNGKYLHQCDQQHSGHTGHLRSGNWGTPPHRHDT